MGKIFNLYENKMDRTWYKSSNIKYSECDDNVDALKTVRIVFGDGRMYQYENVNVNDYLLFREDVSQGKAMNRYLKSYECKRLDDIDIETIEKNMTELMSATDYTVDINSESLTIKDKDNKVLFFSEMDTIKEQPLNSIIKVLNSLSLNIKYNE